MENDDCEFLLPPEFLTDHDILMDFTKSYQNVNKKNGEANSGLLFPNEYQWGLGSYCSDLNSPVESIVSSTETKSDEDDFLAGLTRKMARSALLDDLLKSDYDLGYESQQMANSPQSTLSSFTGRQGCKEDSSRESSIGPSLATSPPSAAKLNRNDVAWKLLHAAAVELARMRKTNTHESSGWCLKEELFCSRPNPVFPANNMSLSYHQLQLAHFQQQQGTVALPVGQNGTRTSGRHPGLSSCAWPSLQQSQKHQPQTSSGMRTLVLGPNRSKRVCAGTGVFLPGRIGSPTESRKKPGCSMVFLPDRVVQALNLNLDMEAHPQLQQQYSTTLSPDYDAPLNYRNNLLMAEQKWKAAMNQDLCLPSEWREK